MKSKIENKNVRPRQSLYLPHRQKKLSRFPPTHCTAAPLADGKRFGIVGKSDDSKKLDIFYLFFFK
jgi:hypothetical protein